MAEFSVDVARLCKKYQDRMDLVVRKLSLDLFSRVILRTPVDKGRARGNWQTGVNSIPAGQIDRDDKTGSAAIAEVVAKTKGVKAGDVVYLANNVPYILPLEYGHSKQAPSGMVRLTIREFNAAAGAAVEQAKRELP